MKSYAEIRVCHNKIHGQIYLKTVLLFFTPASAIINIPSDQSHIISPLTYPPLDYFEANPRHCIISSVSSESVFSLSLIVLNMFCFVFVHFVCSNWNSFKVHTVRLIISLKYLLIYRFPL